MRGYAFSKVCFTWLGLAMLVLLPALPAQAITYANSATAFSWIDPSVHTRVTWTSGASCSAGYASAPIDDDITAQLPLGFTFNYGGVNYTQVQIMSNGRLQFNNGYCGYGTLTVGPPPTYPYPYPNASLVRSMRVYGVDLDATPSGAAGICPTASCYVSYSTVGSAPNRQFVVTWVNVPEWGRTVRTGSFNLQVILYETSNEFVYQFGSSSHPTGGSAQIGWELTTTDYLVWATPVVPTASSAVRFYIPSPIAEFRMDESTWSGAGSVVNSTPSGTNGSPVGTAQTVSGGKICRGGDISANTTAAAIDAVDSSLDVDTQIGSSGTITFWYKSNVAWNGGGSQDSQLLDATTVNDRWFYLVKQQGNGKLRFNLTDSANNNLQVQTGNNTVAANTWTHIAVTWNLTPIAANNRLRIYINGTLAQSTAIGTTNPLSSSIGTLYLGDNRSGFVTNPGTGNSANGVIDEARIYNYEATSAVILRDYNATRSCPAMDHIRLEHDGTGVTCAAEPVTIKACVDAACSTLYTGSATVTLSGSGWATNPVTFTGSTVVNLSITSPQPVTLGASAVAPTPAAGLDCFNGTATNSTTACQLPFADTGFIFSAIPSQAAGVTSGSLTVQAVKKADNSAACVGLFTGDVAIGMASQCVNPTTCAGKQITINSTAIANNPASGIGSYTPVTLNFGANSTASFTLNYPDVGQMSLSARYALGGSDYMTGSSSAFVVRPYEFTLSNIIRTTDGFANPGAAGPAGTAFIKAGDAFSATVTAQAYGGTATPNYGKEIAREGVLLTPKLVAPSGGAIPAISNGTIAGSSFTNGVATVSNLAWDEVGIIKLSPSVADGDYLSAGDVPVTTTSDEIGRFIPHHFALVASTITNRSDLACAPASTFTYMGEPFNLGFTLTAQNASNITTQNYATANGFAKLDGAADPWTAFGANRSLGLWGIGALTTAPYTACNAVFATASPYNTTYSAAAPTCPSSPASPIAQSPVASRISVQSSPAPTGTWTTGTATFSASVIVGRAGVADGPYRVSLGIAPQDADGITLLPSAQNLDADNSGTSERGLLTSTEMRYGRMRISNAYGSELLPLPVPLKAEYRGASGFRINSDDSCTPLVAGDFTLSNPTRNMTPVATTPSFASPLVAGDAKLKLSAPGSGKNGSIDVTVSVPAWLKYDWNTALAGDENPSARAVFGIYQSPVIYLRENY